MQTNLPRWLLLPVVTQRACLVMAFAVLCGMSLIVAEDKPTAAASEKAAHLERMRQLAQSIRLFELVGDQRVVTKLSERPVMGYRDDTRQQHDSTMWIFSVPSSSESRVAGSGRPSAIVAVEHYPSRPQKSEWLFEIASLSTGRIAAERSPELQWQARKPGLELKPLADAPAPAEKPAVRLAQMRELRRRFAAHEREGTDGRIELQSLSAPLYRYQDPERGILDGAVFAFVSGTNPEVLWIIEAHGKQGTAPTWQFGLVQMTGAGVHVVYDNKEIWTRSEANPPAVRDSYVNGWMSASPR